MKLTKKKLIKECKAMAKDNLRVTKEWEATDIKD